MFFEPSTSTIHPTIQHYAAAHPEAAGLPTVRQTITVEREAVTP